MKFEWDNNKNEKNQAKHGISFEEACQIFEDPLHIAILDKRYSYYEERWISIGKMKNEETVVAANLYYDIEGNEIIRIISARYATINERRQYEEGTR